ncbi:MAG: DNA polymerase III subunit alpha [Rickettsiales bacterium]|jgi:DNA polymerase-3 subunit alpha|nr:DNA polymerase III subunit alpha [Rickettsiales bacterium]
MFIHLRNHTEYSLSLGAIREKSMIAKAKELKMPALAVTDSGNMFGALEFSIAASKEGVQPINGCEFVIEKTGLFEKDPMDVENTECLAKIVFLAQTDEGFKNLIALSSENFLKRMENKTPRIKFEWLNKEICRGIICLTGGADGIIGKLLLKNRKNEAEKILLELKEVFEDRLYVEILRHGLKDEHKTEDDFIELANKHNIPIVATNDCYFMNKDNFRAQDILSCIGEKNHETIVNRKMKTPEHYFKTSDEMIELFADIPEAVENTINIAKRISTMAYKRKPTLPRYTDKDKESPLMKKLCDDGLKERLKQKFINEKIIDKKEQEEIEKKYFDRLCYEIGIIEKMDFPGYFLIVQDFIRWCINNNIPVGPGRGSGAGSVVAWSLKITNVDPILFDISFERFLNPERVSMPDFDIDFCQRGRGKAVEYVQNKYGKDLVSQIVTFGKLQSKAVIKDVARVLQFNYNDADNLSKRIPQGSKLQDAISNDENLKQDMIQDSQIGEIIDISLQLEELCKNTSVHAAGVVIGDKPLKEICPLYFADDAEMQTIQYTMKYAEEVGLVKFDFLGLSTLTVIKDVIDDLMENRGIRIDINNIPFDDEKVYEMYANADVLGVFQTESPGMKGNLKQMKPDRIDDITALVALYRPGPMGSIPTYIKRKNGDEKISCLHPLMLKILEKTYGIIVYQDQVMNIARDLAGYTMGGADMLRRAMGKKIKEQMDAQREIFIRGGKIKTTLFGEEVEQEIPGVGKYSGISEDVGNKIFNLMAEFASYGFNLAHATAYGIISYQTAFLKYYFPVEFYVATMNDRIADSDVIATFVEDIRSHNFKVLMPDINKSDIYFKTECIKKNENVLSRDIDGEKPYNFTEKDEENNVNYAVRYGLAGIKGLGWKAAELIIEERKQNGDFKDIYDFIKRFDTKIINKKILESLAKCGAFDGIHNNRRQIHDSTEEIIKLNSGAMEEKNTKQMNFFDAFEEHSTTKLPEMNDWDENERFEMEFRGFGFFIGGHPLYKYHEELLEMHVIYSDSLQDLGNDDRIIMVGVVVSKEIKKNKSGKFAFITLADPKGIIEMTLFSEELLIKHKDLLDAKLHSKVAMSVHIRKDEGEQIRLNISDIASFDDFITGKVELQNPLCKIISQLKIKEVKFANELKEIDSDERFYMAGILEKIDERETKKGSKYLFITINDPKGNVNMSVFDENLVENPILKKGEKIAIACSNNRDEGGRNRLNATDFCKLDDFLNNKYDLKLKRKFSGSSGYGGWHGGGYGGGFNYKKDKPSWMEDNKVPDPVMQEKKQREQKQQIINEIKIYAETQLQIKDIQTVLNSTKKENSNEWTKVILDTGLQKFDLGNKYVLHDEDKKRLEAIKGIRVV